MCHDAIRNVSSRTYSYMSVYICIFRIALRKAPLLIAYRQGFRGVDVFLEVKQELREGSEFTAWGPMFFSLHWKEVES